MELSPSYVSTMILSLLIWCLMAPTFAERTDHLASHGRSLRGDARAVVVPTAAATGAAASDEDVAFQYTVTPSFSGDATYILRAFVVHNVPSGSKFTSTSGTASAFASGRFTLTSGSAGGFTSGTGVELTMLPSDECDVDFALSTEVVLIQDGTLSRSLSTTVNTAVTLTAVADTTSVTVAGSLSGDEDRKIALSVTPGSSSDPDTDDSEWIRLLSAHGLPDPSLGGKPTFSVLLSTESSYASTKYTMTSTKGQGFDRGVRLSLYHVLPADECDIDLDLTYTIFSVENNGKDRSTASANVIITVSAAADDTSVDVIAGNVAEDTKVEIALTPGSTPSEDTDDSEWIRLFSVHGLPAAAGTDGD
eukprot:Rmarinus@m.9982